MTKSQQRALDRMKRFLRDQCRDIETKYGAQITHEDVKVLGEGRFATVSLSAQKEYTALGDGNLLKALSHEWYHFFIGPKGRVEMVSGPKSFEQFKGKGRLVWGFTVKSI